ncbi:MAG: alpha/beta fold hydrolase [Burkholderiales bacterium]
MAHVLLLPHGTSGSIYPFVALGRLLRARGHRVTMVSADTYGPTAARAGFAFHGVGDAALAALLADPALWQWRSGARVSYACAGAYTQAFADAVGHIVAREGMPDLMLAPMINFGARVAREKWGIPLVSVHLYPMMFVTASAVPLFGPEARLVRRMPRWLRRLALLSKNPNDAAAYPAVRAACAALGIDGPHSLWREYWHSPDGVLALFPEWFAPSQPDWPLDLLQWDFPLEDMAAEEPLSAELQAFLARGEAPVVFTPGTGQRHAGAFFTQAAALARRHGVRAVFLSRTPEQVPRDLPATIFTAAYAPFSQLLPHARAFVHHGGIGTLAQGLAAGVPQMITAMSLDQPDNAERIAALGAGAATTLDAFVAGDAAPQFARVLDDPAMREAAAACAQRMRVRPSPDVMLDWLESRQVPSRRTLRARDPAQPPVYLVPGLGADSRNYRGPWTEIPGAVFVEWPRYAGERSVPAIARYVADAWRIPDGAIVVAASFGGAVACEVSRLRSLRALVLISSSSAPEDFVGARKVRRWQRRLPLARVQRFLRRREGIRRQRYGRDPSPLERAVLDAIEQFSVFDLAFFMDMIDAMATWGGGSDPGTPVFRIHGSRDRTVVPPAHADLLLDAGHLAPLTHAAECAAFVTALTAERDPRA